MPKIQTYQDMTVELMQSTPYPSTMVALAQSITMRSDNASEIKDLTHSQAKFLVDAEHMSLFEHVVYTFLIQGVSRSFLAQVTRQRTASPTSGSQHYQDYSDYPCTVHSDALSGPFDLVHDALTLSYGAYRELVKVMPTEEARQVLPNAACVNYLWTIDARNLFYFLRQRLCNRNVTEMRVFANRVLSLVRSHFPELFKLAGPQCYKGDCKQGFLQCQEKYWLPLED